LHNKRSDRTGEETMEGFEVWYEMYPRKVAKKVAQRAWARLTEPEKRKAMQSLPNHIKYWKLQGTEKEYIPHPATWLNQGRADDEIDLTPKEAKKPKLPWYSTDELTIEKGRELGLMPYAGESMGQYRARLSAQISRQAVD
jgi:hypothetical protein